MLFRTSLPKLELHHGLVAGAAASLALAAVLAIQPVTFSSDDAYASIPHPTPHGVGPRLDASVPLTPLPSLSPMPTVVALQDMTPAQAVTANLAIPFSTLPNPAAKAFRMTGAAADDRARAHNCLAQAVYYEAGFEPLAGAQAVAQVVLNRVRHPIFPKTVCGVVYQGSDQKTGCQFSFTCDGSLAKIPQEKAWRRAEDVADAALDGFVMKGVGEATHYHAQYVVPYWSPTLIKLTQIGAHIFYRWTGTFGSPPAFAGHYAGAEPGAKLELAAITPLAPFTPVEAAAVKAETGSTTAASAGEGAGTPAPTAVARPAAPIALATLDTPGDVQIAPPEAVPAKAAAVPQSWIPRQKFRPF